MPGIKPNPKRRIPEPLIVAVLSTMLAAAAPPTPDVAEQSNPAVREALSQGFQGDIVAREQALRQVLEQYPETELAHWHLGEVHYEDEWISIEEVERRVATNPTLSEYRSMRETAGCDPERQLHLAGWCWHHKLRNTAKAHWRQVLANPDSGEIHRRKAFEQLGFQLFGGSYLSKEDIAAIERELASQRKAEAKWVPIISKWVTAIENGPGRRQRYAYQQLHSLNDPLAIPWICIRWRTSFATRTPTS